MVGPLEQKIWLPWKRDVTALVLYCLSNSMDICDYSESVFFMGRITCVKLKKKKTSFCYLSGFPVVDLDMHMHVRWYPGTDMTRDATFLFWEHRRAFEHKRNHTKLMARTNTM